MFRSSVIGIGLAVAALLAFQVTGCGSSGGGGSARGGTTGSAGTNGGAAGTNGGVAGTTGTGGDGNPVGTAGTTGAAGTSATGTAGTTGAAGTSATGTAGTTGAAGTSATGTAGTTGAAGTTGGTAGTTGAGGIFGQPGCPGTVSKGGACTNPDTTMYPPFCYKTCGPQTKGVKSETCTAGVYAEQTSPGCSFDQTMDWSCYKIPTVANAACPAGVTPQASQPCTVADTCTLCNSTGGLAAGNYLDSSSASKVGYCVCVGTAGSTKWSCASDTAWPCPGSAGCQ